MDLHDTQTTGTGLATDAIGERFANGWRFAGLAWTGRSDRPGNTTVS